MATDAIVVLERLSCFREGDASGHSEPYIWPALVWIDDLTLATPEQLGVAGPVLGNARVVLQGDMRAGQSADIPDSVGVLRVRLEDNVSIRVLALVVALLEEDETPKPAMEASFLAFGSELRAAVAANLPALAAARSQSEVDEIIDAIKRRVRAAVRAATGNALTGWQKTRVFLGTLNLDDPVGEAFRAFPPLAPGKPLPGPDKLRPENFSLSLGAPDADNYAIEGQLLTRPVKVDLCHSQAQDVQRAQALVEGIEAEIHALQADLHGGDPGLPKAYLTAEIRRLQQEELPSAIAALEEAQRALQACRKRRGSSAPTSRSKASKHRPDEPHPRARRATSRRLASGHDRRRGGGSR
jgi:hypothetical protein